MKMKVILLILAPLFWAFSCDEKVTLVASYADEFVFPVNVDGNFGERLEIINPDDVTENVESANVEEVNIEYIAVKYILYDDNDASSVVVSGTADDISVFSDLTLTLSDVNENNWVAITNELNETGVTYIKNKFMDYINGDNSDDLILKIVDQSNNTDQLVHADIFLKIAAGIVFTE